MLLKALRAPGLEERLYRQVLEIYRTVGWCENIFRGLAILDHFHLWKKIYKMRKKEIKPKISVTWEAY